MNHTQFVFAVFLSFAATTDADVALPSSGASLNAQNINLDANHDSRDGGGRAAPGAAAEDLTIQSALESTTAPSLARGPRLGPIGESSELKAKNKASSGAIGISFGTSGFGIVIGATSAKGKGEGNTETHIESTVNAQDTLTLTSGQDTTIRGAIVEGNTVIANVGRDLTLESQQDIDNYKNKQTTSGGSIMIGVGFSASASYSQSNVKSTYKSVTEQTAINAGEGGFDIHVGNHTDLKGAVIASKAEKEKNRLSTKTLSYSNIENEAEYDASSYGISLSHTSGGSDGKGLNGDNTALGENWKQVGNTKDSTTGTSLGFSLPQSGKESSTTYAAISPAIIDIRDVKAQQEKTGQTAEETLSGLSRDPSKANNALAKIFDQKKVEETQELTRVLGEEIYKGIGDLAANRHKAAKDEEAKATQRAQNAQLAGDTQAQAIAEAEAKIARDTAERWSDGGTYKIALHALGGAVLAKAGNASVTQAVTAATLNEITIPTIAELAKKEKLSESETRLLHQLTSLAVGGAVGGTTGASVALTATQNNYLKHDEIKKLIDAKTRLKQCATDACRTQAQQEIDQLQTLSQQRDDALAACHDDTSSRCNGLRQEVRSAYAEIIRKTWGRGPAVALNSPEAWDYPRESVRTGKQADDTLSDFDQLKGKGLGMAETVYDGLAAMTQGVVITYKAVTGDTESQNKIGETVDGLATLAITPSLWAQLLENAGTEHNERIAAAYEKGDAVELGRIAGEVAANLPGGIVGATRKVPGVIDDVAKLAEKAKAAEKAVDKTAAITRFETNGLKVAPDSFPDGVKLIRELENSGLTLEQSMVRAKQYVESGSTRPAANPVDTTDRLYKLVPSGERVPSQSAYWLTESELKTLQANPKIIADRLGLPSGSATTQWDVYAMKPQTGAVVFTSEIAPARVTLQDGTSIQRSGGGQQVIVPNRNLFSPPAKVGSIGGTQ